MNENMRNEGHDVIRVLFFCFFDHLYRWLFIAAYNTGNENSCQ